MLFAKNGRVNAIEFEFRFEFGEFHGGDVGERFGGGSHDWIRLGYYLSTSLR